MGYNVYDITKPCYGSLCYNFTYVTRFLNQKKILDALKIKGGKKWESCDDGVFEHMQQDNRTNSAPMLVDLLDNGINVLHYHGELDFSCNWVGGEKAVESVEWYGQSEFKKAKYESIGYGLMR